MTRTLPRAATIGMRTRRKPSRCAVSGPDADVEPFASMRPSAPPHLLQEQSESRGAGEGAAAAAKRRGAPPPDSALSVRFGTLAATSETCARYRRMEAAMHRPCDDVHRWDEIEEGEGEDTRHARQSPRSTDERRAEERHDGCEDKRVRGTRRWGGTSSASTVDDLSLLRDGSGHFAALGTFMRRD